MVKRQVCGDLGLSEDYEIKMIKQINKINDTF